MNTLNLPSGDGTVAPYTLSGTAADAAPLPPATARTAYAAAHVVADPLAPNAPGAPAALDWEATLAFRHHLWDQGLGVAEAMDTAQRGMGLDWAATAELISRTGAEARNRGALLACGVNTDQLDSSRVDLESAITAYGEQLEVVSEAGATPIVMASRALAAVASGPKDYARVYSAVLERADRPVILHWLGTAFDPALAGYWGYDSPAEAIEPVAELIAEHADRVEGIKVSLLDTALEVRLRRLLPDGVRLYTGDDFHYPELVLGDEEGFSHALLGVFAAIAPTAARALAVLDRGDTDGYLALMEPTVPLARHLFSEPTYYYKTGIAFLAWLNGHQKGFHMVGGLHSARDLPHLAHTLRLADTAGVLSDPDLAARRMGALLEVSGVAQ
ncbi:dihydrodipicolinate synthase family protein [Nocardiopsis exhalans]|uniref:Dihydrodipicolinate synthase family protein n=1 Tax=Nocardiopsis exhalans TaxID=163604 RepID=A0ABY5CZ20_9ACTN|nr:dihydrodipicolinate synthase family protein [Nocardiopsis exhalans]USY17072.1 dihydrodipicolinate synthase family protein [Nocardiopsis exhalans]